MARPRLPRALALAAAVFAAAALAACERAAPPPRADSAAPPPPVVSADSAPPPAAPRDSAWEAAGAGPALFVPGDTARPATAAAVLPDSTLVGADSALAAATSALRGVTLELFAPSGKVGTARVDAAGGDGDECAVGPAVRVSGAPPRARWTVAFADGRATAVAVDSVEGLAGADSAARTAEVARLASLVPRTNRGEFAGLPFSVRQARRFTLDGVDVVVAEVVRRIAQEANPREQHVLVVGERPAGRGGKYELAYHETAVGDEAAVETRDVLAVVLLGAARQPTLVLNREFEEGLAYSLLARTGARQWRLQWTSGTVGCGAEG